MSVSNGFANHATNSANELRNAIETLLTAHGTWQFVEEVVITTTTHRVWRCRGSGVTNPNQWGQDFYIDLSWTTAGGTNLTIKAFEAWDGSGKLALRPVPQAVSSNAVNADGSAAAVGGIVLSSTVFGSAQFPLDSSPGTNEYWLVALRNGLYVSIRRSSLPSTFYGAWLGLFESSIPAHAQEFPLMISGGNSTSVQLGGTFFSVGSRHPARGGQAANASNFGLASFLAWTQTLSDSLNVDLFHGKARMPRVMVRQTTSVASVPTFGFDRGRMYPAFAYLAPGSGDSYGFGDTLTADGKEYLYAPVGNMANSWVDKTAV